MITPTNGRQVWFYPNGTFLGEGADLGQPLAATVVHVWGDRLVNLQVLGADGKAYQVTSVVLLQDDDAAPVNGFYAQWMPYQKTQAKAQEKPDYVQRMLVERQELVDKVIKLGEFIRPTGASQDTVFNALPHIEQRLMVDQYSAMEAYLQALSARLALLGH